MEYILNIQIREIVMFNKLVMQSADQNPYY